MAENLFIMFVVLATLVVGTVTLHLQNPEFDSRRDFACRGFSLCLVLQVLRGFLPQSKEMHIRLIVVSKLPYLPFFY